MMDRRRFLLGIAPALAAWAAHAQQKVRRIGLLSASGEASMVELVAALLEGLRAYGYVEGKNLVLDRRYAAGNLSLLPQLCRELLAAKPELLVVPADTAALIVREQSKEVPIVLALSSDPVEVGLAASLARPGRNTTGVTTLALALVAKRFELLKEAFPGLDRVAVLDLRDDPGRRTQDAKNQLQLLEPAARQYGVNLIPIGISSPDEIAPAVAAAAKAARAALAVAGPFMFTHRDRIAAAAIEHRLPVMASETIVARAGALMAYSVHFPSNFRRAAYFVHRILGGARAGDLPIEQPTRFELVVNLKTARAIGIAIPPSILLRADVVIE